MGRLPTELRIETGTRTQFLDITTEVARAVREAGLSNGTVVVFVPHTTAGMTINEHADPDVVADLIAALERLVPWKSRYAHAEGNSAAHIKASLIGSSVTVPVGGGRLLLGTWQGIFLAEFDGPRSRRVLVSCLPA